MPRSLQVWVLLLVGTVVLGDAVPSAKGSRCGHGGHRAVDVGESSLTSPSKAR